MIIDNIERLCAYQDMNSGIAKVVGFLRNTDLAGLAPGHHDIDGDNVYVNVVVTKPKSREETVMECHRKMIDIHVPITGSEEQGWRSAGHLSDQPYDEAGDCTIHPDECETYYTILPGQFSIHFPGEGHSPAISKIGIKKCIFKLKASSVR